jgi:hypothetical protein
LACGDAHHVARGGQHDEELVAPEDELREHRAAEERRPAGALHDEEAGAEQHVAAEGEDRRRGVHRPQPPEGGPGQVEIEHWKGQLQRDHDADQEGDDAPEGRGDDELADHRLLVGGGDVVRAGG